MRPSCPFVQLCRSAYESRVKATLIDAFLIWIAAVVLYFGLGVLIFRGGPGQDAARTLVLALVYIGPTVYYVVSIAEAGQTIGKMMSNVRVLRDADGTRVGYLRSLLRAVFPTILWFTVIGGILDVLWPLWDSKHQTLHDKIAGTVVVGT